MWHCTLWWTRGLPSFPLTVFCLFLHTHSSTASGAILILHFPQSLPPLPLSYTNNEKCSLFVLEQQSCISSCNFCISFQWPYMLVANPFPTDVNSLNSYRSTWKYSWSFDPNLDHSSLFHSFLSVSFITPAKRLPC